MRTLLVVLVLVVLGGCAGWPDCYRCETDDCQSQWDDVIALPWDTPDEEKERLLAIATDCAESCTRCEEARAERAAWWASRPSLDPASAMLMLQGMQQQYEMQRQRQMMRDMSDNWQRMNGYRVPPLYP